MRSSGEAVVGRLRIGLVGLLTAALVAPVGAAAADQVAPGTELAAGAAAASVLSELDGAARSVDEADVGDAIADRLLVTFHAGVPDAVAAEVLRGAGVDGQVVPGFGVVVVDVDPADAAAAVVTLSAAPEVAEVRPDRLLEFRTAADPRRAEQWWWRNTGQDARASTGGSQSGRRGVDIGAALAWRATRGKPSVVVAVVDTGLDVRHPDLAPNLWRNPRPGTFGRCTDDVHGCNFTASGPSGTVYSGPDEDEHGTHVAGVIAAAENDIGTVGVAPRVQLMSVKFLRNQNGSVADGVLAMQYAVAMGADVINASWGVPGTATSSRQHAAIERTIADARIPVVVAAGNGGTFDASGCQRLDLARYPEYPASSRLPNVITVTAVDNRGAVPCFANHSSSLVDVAAPGFDVLSTAPDAAHVSRTGTSQAAPMVSGAIALAISATGVRDGSRLAAAVRAGARPFGPLSDLGRPSGSSRAGLASAPGTLQALGIDLGACRAGAPSAGFRDLPSTDVHRANVDCVAFHGLASGYPDGTYKPGRTVTRGQVATFLAGLYRTARDLPVPDRGRFPDLRGDVHRDNIEALAAVGIIGGRRDGTFGASDRVTREQFATLLMRTYEHLAGGRVRPEGGSFPDVRGSVHEHNVRTAAHVGFVLGRNDGRFGPRDGVTRAQLGSLLRRALDKLVTDRVSSVG